MAERIGVGHQRAGGRPSATQVVLAVVLAGGLLAVVVGSQVYEAVFNPFPRGYCSGVALAEPIGDAAPDAGVSLAASPQHAVDDFLASPEPQLVGEPLPRDGWEERDGRWVRDLGDDSYAELELRELDGGWAVVGRSTCGR